MDMPHTVDQSPSASAAHRCPSCSSTGIDRAPRRGLEHLLPFRRPYECWACGRRFLDRPSRQS